MKKSRTPEKHIGNSVCSVTVDSPCCPAGMHERCRLENGGCALEHLRIALVGGLDRLEDKYQEAFEKSGAEFRFHSGVSGGGSAVRLKTLANWADVVVFVTRVNSHNAMNVVKGICRKSGKSFLALRETNPTLVSKLVANEWNNRRICRCPSRVKAER